YDRRVLTGLRSLGLVVREHAVPGSWPFPSAAARSAVARLTATDGILLVDGLVASAVPELLLAVADRVVVLVHRALGGAGRAAVGRHKGHDLLVAALDGLPCRCVCVGSLTRDPAFVAGLARPGNVSFAGPLVRADLAAAYAGADLLVLPSRGETYGMVVTEAL